MSKALSFSHGFEFSSFVCRRRWKNRKSIFKRFAEQNTKSLDMPCVHGFLDSSCFVSQRSCRREPQVYFLLWMSLRNLYYVSRLFSWRGSLDCMSCYSSSSYLLAPSVVASSYCKYKGCPSSTVSVSIVSVMHDLIIIIICSQSILNNFRVQWLKEENSPHLALLFFVPFWGSRFQVISKPSLFKQHWFRES